MISRLTGRVAGMVGATIDQGFVRWAFSDSPSVRRGSPEAILHRLAEATELYDRADADGTLFVEPALPRFHETRVRRLRGGEVVDITWPSDYRPLHPAFESTLAKYPENNTCHARWYRHATARPAIICLHGWGAGFYALEERAYPAKWLYKIGLDVLIPNLPFHALRRPQGKKSPPFPSPDPVRSNEGFAQAVSDLRALICALRHRGADKVAVTGMSLGGFTSALLATVVDDLDAVIPIIPFASLPRMLWEHGEKTEAQRRARDAGVTLELFENALAATTPIRRRPTTDPSRMLIIAGRRDRVTPYAYSKMLHEHFEGSQLTTFAGAHILQVGRGKIFRRMARFLREREVIDRSP